LKSKRTSIKRSPEAPLVYVIKVDEKVIWEGRDLTKQIKKVKSENPQGTIAIAWKSNKEFLIV